jgi:heme-degrading monooxygenase HmoA
MAIAVTITTPLDAATYDQLIGHHEPHLRHQAGFQFHYAQPTTDGWTVTEIWDSAEAHAAWFDTNAKPHLPAGVHHTVGATA